MSGDFGNSILGESVSDEGPENPVFLRKFDQMLLEIVVSELFGKRQRCRHRKGGIDMFKKFFQIRKTESCEHRGDLFVGRRNVVALALAWQKLGIICKRKDLVVGLIVHVTILHAWTFAWNRQIFPFRF